MAQTFKINGLEVSNGNSKLGNDTLIINMGSGTNCPSAKRGLCKLGKKCYALKAERVYKQVLPCRNRQEAYWLNTSAAEICIDFSALLLKHKALGRRVKYLRFNESGDFHSQACIDKLDEVAAYLRDLHGIVTYGYSARSDLDFQGVAFNCKGSSHDKGNHGKTIARKMSQETKAFYASNPSNDFVDGDETFKVCPGSCKTCKLCKVSTGLNIVFPLH